jgi:adenosylcobinamide-phosphate synthase
MISLLALTAGFLIDMIAGDPHGLPHPVVYMGKTIALLEKLLRKAFPKTPAGERAAGALMWLLVAGGSFMLPFLLLKACAKAGPYLRFALESLMCWQVLAAKSLKDESVKVERALKDEGLEAARRAVSMIVGRDTERLDEAGVIRAAVETVAENTSDGVIAPIFYIALGGPLGGCLYKAANTMDSMVGYKNDRYIDFGRCAALFDDVVNYIPARLAALELVLAAYLTGMDGKNAWRIWKRDRRNHASPNSAQTESAVAGALGLRLAGDAVYFGKLHKKPFIGDDLRPIEPEDIRRSHKLMFAATGEMLVLALAVMLSIHFL